MKLLTDVSKYMFILLLLLFTLRNFTYFRKHDEEKRRKTEGKQAADIILFDILGFIIIFLHTFRFETLILLVGVIVYTAATIAFYRLLYKGCSLLLINNMLLLLSIGFVILARLDLSKALKQYVIAAAGTVLALFVPVIVRKLRILPRLTWIYAGVGVLCLLGVMALAVTSGGAKLSIEIGGVTVQFSELVKITFVFFMAAQLSRSTSFGSVAVTSAVAAVHVGILVLSTDLGTALVFFIAYLVMVLVATRKPWYSAAALAAGAAASVAAYYLFGHVRQRVEAWLDPFAVYDSSGYQIVQGLFGISAGSWFGSGLGEGMPGKIPVAAKDFIFAAICEEFGVVFGIALILVCMTMFLLIVNISIEIRRPFYKLIAIGLGTEYAFQVFLTIGGVTKFIPMTGITLPLVSYGGSSVICTILMLAIVEGLYILREDEGEIIEKEKRKRERARRNAASEEKDLGGGGA